MSPLALLRTPPAPSQVDVSGGEGAHRRPVVPAAVDALRQQLRSLRDLVAGLTGEIYEATPSRASGSIGQHVRHCVDHATALVAAGSRVEFSYDARIRGTRVETDPAAAVVEVDRLCLQLDEFDARSLDRPLWLRTQTHVDGPQARVATTLGREVAFVLQHTVHHAALIAVLLDGQGLAVPPRFGYAPSTPART
jgi:uncharacterized damage-inducible protein DinB